ncbi:MAG: alkaline phosphatase family protein, partial [Terracidiphilus sp.]
GHANGPDSASQEQMILSLDRDFNSFFNWLDHTIGLNNVWIALTADHGVAPVSAEAAHLGINAAQLDMKALYASLNEGLNQLYSPGAGEKYLMPGPDLPYIVLDKRAFAKVHIDERAAEDEVAALLPGAIGAQAPALPDQLPAQYRLAPTPQFAGAYTRLALATGQLPSDDWGRLLAHSYVDHGNWFVMLIIGGYQMPLLSKGTTHFSPWSYDRHVPLAFYGAPFIPGEYHGRVAPVDLAATFASLAGVNQPSASIGHVLTQAIRTGTIRPAH